MKKHILFILGCMLLPAVAIGQYTSSKERPAWVDGFFQEEENSYIEVASAVGATEDIARNEAALIIIKRRSGATGQRVSITVRNGEIQVDGDDALTVKARVIGEYREYRNGEHRVSLLVQIAKNPMYEFEKVNVTNKYPFSARVFVPGMAQIHKGSTTKGILFIVGEVAMIGGVVACEGLRASYTSKINSTHNAAERQTYINNADMMQNVRNGFIAGAAAVYVWNIIDGAVAKGKTHVMIGEARMQFSPYVSPQSGGIMLTLNF